MHCIGGRQSFLVISEAVDSDSLQIKSSGKLRSAMFLRYRIGKASAIVFEKHGPWIGKVMEILRY